MAKKWQSSSHAISDIRDWNDSGTLLLTPDYQRREVWGDAARIMLIDSILNGIPMPKIFVSSKIKEGRTYRSVIDGQQRITAILKFLSNDFNLESPYAGPYMGKYFSELPQDVQDDVILAYDIDFNEAKGLSEGELREVYSRVNKYLIALNRQELRKADFPGVFLTVADDLANLSAWDDFGLFNATARRRSLDVEYVCELLAAQLKGISDKKDAIDDCCKAYAEWPTEDAAATVAEFKSTIADLSAIFDASFSMRKTRWKQKADFYSFFFAILSLKREGLALPSDLSPLRKDLVILDGGIAPTSEFPILSKYAVYCVSQANSASSRNWRMEFIRAVLRGTYAGSISEPEQRKIIGQIASDLRFARDPNSNGDGCPPAEGFSCEACGKVDEGETSLADSILYWNKGTIAFQLSNARWAHSSCEADIAAEAIIKGTDIPGAISDDDDFA